MDVVLKSEAGVLMQAQPEEPNEAEVLGEGVLIVDDSQLMLLRMRELVERQDFKVVGTANSAEKALQLLQKIKPRLIILDHNLPQMSGVEFLQKLRQTDKVTRVIVCSGTLTFDAGRDFLAAGACELIAKPVQLDQFVPALKRCMSTQMSGQN